MIGRPHIELVEQWTAPDITVYENVYASFLSRIMIKIIIKNCRTFKDSSVNTHFSNLI